MIIRFVCAALLLTVPGCGGLLGPDDLELTVDVTAAVYPHDGPFGVSVTATNTSDERVMWGQGSSSCQLEAVIRVGGRDHRFASRVCTADLAPLVLEPGASRTEHFPFEGQYLADGAPVQVPPGTYAFRGIAGEVARSAPVTVEIR